METLPPIDVEMSHTKYTLASLTTTAASRKDLVKDRTLVLERTWLASRSLKAHVLARNSSSERGDFLIQQVDVRKNWLVALQLAGIGITSRA